MQYFRVPTVAFSVMFFCWQVDLIGHFRVLKTLTFKMRLGAQPFLWKWVSFAWEWKMISISKAEHLPSFWNRGQGELGNGLLKEAEIKCVHFSLLPKNVFSTEICSNFSKASYSEQPHCERLVRFSASGIHQQNNYELKAEKGLGPQAAQTKSVSITWTKWDESSNLPWPKIVQKSKYNQNFSSVDSTHNCKTRQNATLSWARKDKETFSHRSVSFVLSFFDFWTA